MPARLTKRRLDYLEAIDAAISAHGEPPTYRELAAIVEVGSTNAVFDALIGLERLGLVVMPGNRNHQLKLTAKGLEQLGYRPCPCCGAMTRKGAA